MKDKMILCAALFLALFVGLTPFTPLYAPFANVANAQVITEPIDASTVGSNTDLSIGTSGIVTADGVYVEQFIGTSFYARIYWGATYIRLLVRTNPNTNMTKKYGGSISASQLSVGDFVSVTGTINPSSDSLDITATTLKDWSIQTQADQVSGTVTSLLATSNYGFVLKQANGTSIDVGFATTSQIIKGTLVIAPSQISAGDKITTATGIFSPTTNTLTASSVIVYEDMSLFAPQNFQGTLVSLAGTTLPTSMVMTISGQQYTVKLTSATSVLNNARATVLIGRYLPGDTVRVYGSIEEANHGVIDSQIVRNTSI